LSENDVFHAIAHPTRRELLRRLSNQDGLSLTELTQDFAESRQAIRKHVRVLTESELIRMDTQGREQRCTLQTTRLAEIRQWLNLFEDHWDQKLQQLKSFVEQKPTSPTKGSSTMAKKKAAKKVAKRTAAKSSPVKGKTVAWYVGTLEGWQAELVREVDQLIMATIPKATSSIKWAQPVYECQGPFCFMKAAKKHVTFGFWRGAELDDPKELLEGTGQKMRHVKLREIGDIQRTVFKKMIKQAAKLNELHGDPSK